MGVSVESAEYTSRIAHLQRVRAAGHEVTQADISVTPMPIDAVETAGLIALFLPMHTATKLFLRLVDRIRAVNPRAHLCAYGLYAPLNERLLRGAGIGTILGGEFESGLRDLAGRLAADTPMPTSAPGAKPAAVLSTTSPSDPPAITCPAFKAAR